MSYDNTNRFALWNNKNQKTEKHPNFTGSLTAVCPHCQATTEYFADAWATRNPEGNRPPISGKIKPKDQQPQSAPQEAAQPEFDDDIPF